MNINLAVIPSPCYVLDESLLIKNLELLQQIEKEAGVKILCALKGYAMWSTFPLVRKFISGATASSVNEARLCFEEMKSKTHSCCPIYNEDSFDEIIRYSSHITFNSFSQFNKHYEQVLKSKEIISCGLRINPGYSEVNTEIYNPCTPGSRLGIPADQFCDKLPKGIEGLHFHSLCENDSFVLERTLHEVEKQFGEQIKQVKWMNLGGGHHITRNDYDVKHLINLLKDFKERYKNLEEVILEPGEAIGWETGYLVSTIKDIIENKGVRVAILDVSFSAHMPDCLEMPYKPSIVGGSDTGDKEFKYRFGGNSCLAGDFVGDYYFQKRLKVDDRIVFEDMIHYTMVKTTHFNGVQHPSIGIWTKDGEFHLQREFGYEDYKNNLS